MENSVLLPSPHLPSQPPPNPPHNVGWWRRSTGPLIQSDGWSFLCFYLFDSVFLNNFFLCDVYLRTECPLRRLLSNCISSNNLFQFEGRSPNTSHRFSSVFLNKFLSLAFAEIWTVWGVGEDCQWTVWLPEIAVVAIDGVCWLPNWIQIYVYILLSICGYKEEWMEGLEEGLGNVVCDRDKLESGDKWERRKLGWRW